MLPTDDDAVLNDEEKTGEHAPGESRASCDSGRSTDRQGDLCNPVVSTAYMEVRENGESGDPGDDRED